VLVTLRILTIPSASSSSMMIFVMLGRSSTLAGWTPTAGISSFVGKNQILSYSQNFNFSSFRVL
jgi:hypothetical protein